MTKLLFDQNLSYKLVEKLSTYFPDASHVRLIHQEKADDISIFDFARNNNYVIVSKDSDFYELSLLYGSPPKVIWIRSGNINFGRTLNLFIKNQDLILKFFEGDNECLELY